MKSTLAGMACAVGLLGVLGTGPVSAQTATPAAAVNTRNLAPGFTDRTTGSKLVLVPADLELLSISAGGVPEPREDWTQAAQLHVRAALAGKADLLGARVQELSER